jgi:hypothetical protein
MKYQIVNNDHPRAMRLQSIGLVLGTPAGEIKPGDCLMWNFGYTSEVNSIIKETPKTLTISIYETSLMDNKTKKLYERKLNKNRLVCLLSK